MSESTPAETTQASAAPQIHTSMGPPGPKLLALRAIVKSVQSGDTLVLRNRSSGQERILHLANLTAPRVGSRDRQDEMYAVQSRDFLRTMVVGKEVSFEIHYVVPASSSGAPAMEFGDVVVQKPNSTETIDVALAVVSAGCAKVRESRNVDIESASEQTRKVDLREAEEAAKNAGRGLWADNVTRIDVAYNMPNDPDAFLAEHGNGQKLEACIEGVNNGSTVRARLQIGPSSYHIANIAMAGCRAPRAKFVNSNNSDNTANNDTSELCGDEARSFTETRLLQRNVHIQLISLPPVPLSAASSAPTFFIGHVLHPAGNIAQLLVQNGLARCVDQHAALLGAEGMAGLRNAEKSAKAARLGIWSSLPAAPIMPTRANGANGTNGVTGNSSAHLTASGIEKNFEGIVSRVWSADSLSIRQGKHGDGSEVKVFLASIRQPRAAETRLAGLRSEALEFLRKRAIGKHVEVVIEYSQPKSDQFEAKEMATVKLANGANLAEGLVQNGYATVVRHRQGDEDKSSEIDKLMEVEAKAIADKKGLHSGKEYPPLRIGDASESSSKANSFLPQLKRGGKFSCVVDYVPSGSRFKLMLPKQDVKITLVLGGIRAPRTARNPGEKSDPFGAEAQDFVLRRCLQRDAEAEVDTTDKVGGFIGSLYVNKQNVAVMLVREGLARVDEYNSTQELKSAEEDAKREKKNIWQNHEAEDVAASASADASSLISNTAGPRREYVDVIVSDIRTEPAFGFSVQVLQPGGKLPELEQLMKNFAIHHRTASNAPISAIRPGDVISARFSVDKQWYRAKVRKSNAAKKSAEVVFYDYGNTETVTFDCIRPLEAQFKSLPAQAKEANLSFISLLGPETDYAVEAVDLFREMVEGRPLVANIDRRDANSVSVTLFDANVSKSSTFTDSINVELVRSGLAKIDKKSPLRSAYPHVVKALEAAQQEAKRTRAGAFELGDFLDQDD